MNHRLTPPLDPFFFDISPLRALYTGGVFPDFYKDGRAGTFEPDAAIQPGWVAYSEVQIWGKLDLADVETIFIQDTEHAAFTRSPGARILQESGVTVKTYTTVSRDERRVHRVR